MKSFVMILSLAVTLSTSVSSLGFTNLNFESAVVQVNDPNFGFLDWPLAVPGWNHSTGSATEIVYYGRPHLGLAQGFLLIDNTNPFPFFPFGSFATPLAGDYSLAFASGYAFADGQSHENWTRAFISQTGDIPADARSLRLLATGPFAVFLGGVSIPMFSLGGDMYGGSITNFAGNTAELTIMNAAPYDWVQTPTRVDNIIFSPIAIPEPTRLAVFALGLVVAALHGRRRSDL